MALRENPFGELKVPLAWTAGVALVVAMVVALVLLMSDRRETFQTVDPATQAVLAAAPPHGYWTVTFKARYSKKGNATETVSLAWEDGAWKVASVSVE